MHNETGGGNAMKICRRWTSQEVLQVGEGVRATANVPKEERGKFGQVSPEVDGIDQSSGRGRSEQDGNGRPERESLAAVLRRLGKEDEEVFSVSHAGDSDEHS